MAITSSFRRRQGLGKGFTVTTGRTGRRTITTGSKKGDTFQSSKFSKDSSLKQFKFQVNGQTKTVDNLNKIPSKVSIVVDIGSGRVISRSERSIAVREQARPKKRPRVQSIEEIRRKKEEILRKNPELKKTLASFVTQPKGTPRQQFKREFKSAALQELQSPSRGLLKLLKKKETKQKGFLDAPFLKKLKTTKLGKKQQRLLKIFQKASKSEQKVLLKDPDVQNLLLTVGLVAAPLGKVAGRIALAAVGVQATKSGVETVKFIGKGEFGKAGRSAFITVESTAFAAVGASKRIASNLRGILGSKKAQLKFNAGKTVTKTFKDRKITVKKTKDGSLQVKLFKKTESGQLVLINQKTTKLKIAKGLRKPKIQPKIKEEIILAREKAILKKLPKRSRKKSSQASLEKERTKLRIEQKLTKPGKQPKAIVKLSKAKKSQIKVLAREQKKITVALRSSGFRTNEQIKRSREAIRLSKERIVLNKEIKAIEQGKVFTRFTQENKQRILSLIKGVAKAPISKKPKVSAKLPSKSNILTKVETKDGIKILTKDGKRLTFIKKRVKTSGGLIQIQLILVKTVTIQKTKLKQLVKQKARQVQKQQIKTKSRQKSKQKQVSVQKQKQKQKVRQKRRVIQSTRQRAAQLQKSIQKQGQIGKQAQKPVSKQIQKLKSIQKPADVQIAKQAQKPAKITRTIRSRTKKPTKPRTQLQKKKIVTKTAIKLRKQKKKSKKGLQRGFIGQVRSRGTKVRGTFKKGKFLNAIGSTTRNRALKEALFIANHSVARSVRIVRGSKVAQKKDIQKPKILSLFRKAKNKRSLVEKTKFAINTSGERQGITAKGLIASRRKKKNGTRNNKRLKGKSIKRKTKKTKNSTKKTRVKSKTVRKPSKKKTSSRKAKK